MNPLTLVACVLLSAPAPLRIEAERFPIIVGARPEKRFAADASGHAYVFLPKGPMTLDQPIKARMAVDFDVSTRMCLINVRYRIENRGSDSFYWRLNDEDWRSFPMRAGVYNKWVWDEVKAVIKKPGKQRLWIAAREPTRIDVVEITPVELPPTPQTRVEYKKATAFRAAKPIVVDGKLDDWRDVDAAAGLVMGERYFVHVANHYYGPNDASAVAYLKWDPSHVYVAVVVQDDVCRNTRSGGKKLQEGDGVLLNFIPRIPDRKRRSRYPYACIVTPGDFQSIPPQVMRVQGPLPKIARAARKTKFGYVLEFAIDTRRWKKLPLKEGETIGFEICLYDSDTRFGTTRRSTILAWNSLADRMNAAECGELTLGPAATGRPKRAAGDALPAALVKKPFEAKPIRRARMPYREGFGFFLGDAAPETLQRKLRGPKAQAIFNDRLLVLADRYMETWRPGEYQWTRCETGHARQAAKVIDRLGMAYLLTGEDSYGSLAADTTVSIARALPACVKGNPLRLAYLTKAVVLGADWTDAFLSDAERRLVKEALRAAVPRLQKQGWPLAACVTGLAGLALDADELVAASRAKLAACVKAGLGEFPDDSDLAHMLLFEEALRRRGKPGLDVDWRALFDKQLRAFSESTPAGPALNAAYTVFLRQPHRMVAAWVASRLHEPSAAWFLQECFKVVATSSRDGDETYTLLWLDESNLRAAAPKWLTEKAQQAWLKQTRERVLDWYRRDERQRADAMKRKRRVVWRGKPFDPKKAVLDTVDESILKQFAVKLRPSWLRKHPRLFVTDADRRLWAARLAATHAGAWRRAEECNLRSVRRPYLPLLTLRGSNTGNVWPEGRSTGTMLGQHALAYALTRDDLHAEFAKRYLLGVCAEKLWDLRYPDLVHGHALCGAGIAYDQLYHYLMPSERRFALGALQRQCEIMYRAIGRNLRRPGDMNNHLWIRSCGLAIAASAIYEDTPQAQQWLDYARYEFNKILAVLGPDGATPEGFHMYVRYGTEWLLRYLELLYQSTGESLYDHPWLRNNGYCFLYTLMPDGQHVANFGDNPDKGGDSSHIAFRYASQYRDGHFQWLGLEFQKQFRANSRNAMWSLLWYDPSVAAQPPNDLPTWRYFDDLEMVIARSDWTRDATCFAFRCGPPMGHHAFAYSAGGYGHAHQDQNHFMLFSRGEFLVSDPGYSRYKLTQEHNTLLVDGRGQIGEGTRWFHRKLKADELATIRSFFGSPGYVSVCGDATQAYWKGLGLKKFLRHAMFIDGRLLVLYDEVATDKPRRYDWLLHGSNPFAARGAGVFVSAGKRARLFVRMLRPTDIEYVAEPFLVRRGAVYHADGHVTIPKKGFPSGQWLKITPKGRRAAQEFVTVLVPQALHAAAPTAELCAGGAGLHVNAGDREYWVAFAARDGRVSAGPLAGLGGRGYVCRRAGRVEAFALEEGTRLTCDGRPLVEADAPVSLAYAAGRVAAQAKTKTSVRLRVNGRTVRLDLDAGGTARSLP